MATKKAAIATDAHTLLNSIETMKPVRTITANGP